MLSTESVRHFVFTDSCNSSNFFNFSQNFYEKTGTIFWNVKKVKIKLLPSAWLWGCHVTSSKKSVKSNDSF